MKIQNIIKTLPVVVLFCSCQSEAPQIDNTHKRFITVTAFLPDSDNTRSHITYGNTEIDREIFRWHPFQNDPNKDDYIAVFNVSKSTDYVELSAVKIDGNSAVFQSEESDVADLKIEAGDILFVNYWYAERVNSNDNNNIYKIPLTSGSQPILEDPSQDSYMTFMQGDLKMYDIVTAVEDGKIPDIHFKHLSAIMRVTFRNETGSPFNPKEFIFEYPGTKSFFSSYIYCSIDPDSEDGSGLKIHTDFDNYPTYSDICTTSINNYTAAQDAVTGEDIPDGGSYELYLSCVPRIANKNTGEKLIINLGKRLGSGKSKLYEMTLDGFDVPIEAGKRYWFNLTAVEDKDGNGKLIFTPDLEDWLKENPKNNPENGEQNSSGEE